jgi:hypothetical protein
LNTLILISGAFRCHRADSAKQPTPLNFSAPHSERFSFQVHLP